MSASLTARIAEDFAAAHHAQPASARRQAALAALTAAGLPSARDENWKYVNFRPLERLRFVPAPASEAALPALPPALQNSNRTQLLTVKGPSGQVLLTK